MQWRINVNNLNMKQIVRSERHCDYCINNKCGKFCEDERHVIFHCEAYGKCRLRHQPLFHGTEHNLECMNEGIHLDLDTWIVLILSIILRLSYPMITRLVLLGCYGISGKLG